MSIRITLLSRFVDYAGCLVSAPLLCALIQGLVISSASADNCTEGLVRALKSEYGNIESGTIDDVLYEVACHESQRTVLQTIVWVGSRLSGTFGIGSVRWKAWSCTDSC
jgi:hypothetical protein